MRKKKIDKDIDKRTGDLMNKIKVRMAAVAVYRVSCRGLSGVGRQNIPDRELVSIVRAMMRFSMNLVRGTMVRFLFRYSWII